MTFSVGLIVLIVYILGCIDLNCGEFTVCTSTNCSNLRKSNVKAIFFRELVLFCEKLSEFCCDYVDSYFIIDVFQRYKRGEDYFSAYLNIERNE